MYARFPLAVTMCKDPAEQHRTVDDLPRFSKAFFLMAHFAAGCGAIAAASANRSKSKFVSVANSGAAMLGFLTSRETASSSELSLTITVSSLLRSKNMAGISASALVETELDAAEYEFVSPGVRMGVRASKASSLMSSVNISIVSRSSGFRLSI
eukprot:4243397-Lingulodinium_polyedra.AAC.1